MLMRKIVRFAMSSQTKITRIPKAPRLLSGELENFRFDSQHARLFDGYTLDELYGSKIGLKHSPAVKAEMRKDTFASIVVFAIGLVIIFHFHDLDMKKLNELNELNRKRESREVKLPEGMRNTLQKSHLLPDEVISI